MGIPYYVYQVTLGQQSRHLGRLLLKGTCGQEALVDRMLSMGSSLTKPDITAVLQLLVSAVGQLCKEGHRVDLEGLVKITPTLGGEFDGRSDVFQAPRNSLYLTAQVSKALNQRFSGEARAEKAVVEPLRPVLIRVVDSEADPGTTSLSTGHIISVTGKHLKFDPSRAEEYLRLVDARNPDEFVAVPKFHKITQRELVFRLPEAAFTEGYFEVASSLGSTSLRVGQSLPFSLRPK
jgi:hypothetical protein